MKRRSKGKIHSFDRSIETGYGMAKRGGKGRKRGRRR